MQNHSILVVEDNFVNQRIIVGMLKKFGHPADVTENGLQAVAAYNDKHYDLVLMDCEMPEMDGFDATLAIRKIEQQENKARVPIVALTAHAFEDVKQRCLAAGMDDFITKPLQLTVIESMLQRWLSSN